MKLIPYERLTIKTMLRPEQVIRRLEEKVEPGGFHKWREKHKPYQGQIELSHFYATRIHRIRSFMVPDIYGKIRAEMEGSSILITMYPNPPAMILTVFWLVCIIGPLLSLFLPSLSSALHSSGRQPTSSEIILTSAVLFVFGYLLLWGSFKLESIKSKAYFRELLQARQVDEFEIASLFGNR